MSQNFKQLKSSIAVATGNARLITGPILASSLLNSFTQLSNGVEKSVTSSTANRVIFDLGLPDATVSKLFGDRSALQLNIIKHCLVKNVHPSMAAAIGEMLTGVDGREHMSVEKMTEKGSDISMWLMTLGDAATALHTQARALEEKINNSFRAPVVPIVMDAKGQHVNIVNAGVAFRGQDRYISKLIKLCSDYDGTMVSAEYLIMLCDSIALPTPAQSMGITKIKAGIAKIQNIFRDLDINSMILEQKEKIDESSLHVVTKSLKDDAKLYLEYMNAVAEVTEYYWSTLSGSLWHKAMGRKWAESLNQVEADPIVDILSKYMAMRSKSFGPEVFIDELDRATTKYAIELVVKISTLGPLNVPDSHFIEKVFSERGTTRRRSLLCDGTLNFIGSSNDITKNHKLTYRVSEAYKEADHIQNVPVKGDIGILFRPTSTDMIIATGHIPASELISSLSSKTPHDDRDQVEHTVNLDLANVLREGISVWDLSGLCAQMPHRLVPQDYGPVSIVDAPRIMDRSMMLSAMQSNITYPTEYLMTHTVAWFSDHYLFQTWGEESGIRDYLMMPLASGIEQLKPNIVQSVTTQVKEVGRNLIEMLVEIAGAKSLAIDPDLALSVMRWDIDDKYFSGISLSSLGLERRDVTPEVKSFINQYIIGLSKWLVTTDNALQLRRTVEIAKGDTSFNDRFGIIGMKTLLEMVGELSKPWLRLYVVCRVIEILDTALPDVKDLINGNKEHLQSLNIVADQISKENKEDDSRA